MTDVAIVSMLRQIMQLRVSASFGKIYLRNDYCCKKTQQNSCMKLVTVNFFKGRSTPSNLSIFILFLHPSNFLRLLFFVFYKLNSKLSSILILRPVIGFMANFKILFLPTFELLSCVYNMTSQAPN